MTANPPERLRVLHAVKGLGLGGTEKVAQLLACHLPRGRFEAAVHSPADGPRAAQIRACGLATYVGMDLGRALAAFRPQVVHVHRAGWPEPEFLRPIRDYRRANPALVCVETNVFGRHDPSASARVIDTHLFVSHFCAERFARLHGVTVEWPAYGVLYNPVDTDRFAELLPGGAAARGPVLGRVSRADPGKWSRLALDILPALASVPGFRYRVVGGVPEAAAYVREHGLDGCVEFLPPLESDAELAAFYGSLAVLAHANDTGESFGLVIAEAMACGLSVVTHPCPGERDNAQLELVEQGVTGLVASTAEDYAAAVLRLFGDPEEARRMGLAGRDKARRLFRVQDVAARLGEMYLDLLARKGVRS
jgi:glycosyltransferase involved in cell wall biosynthesis